MDIAFYINNVCTVYLYIQCIGSIVQLRTFDAMKHHATAFGTDKLRKRRVFYL